MILDRIVAQTRQTLVAAQEARPQAQLEAQLAAAPPLKDLAAALKASGVSLIAEVKKASPSRGLLAPDFDPVGLAATYARCEAAAISVLTDAPFFQGDLAYLAHIRQALADGPPLLRKDFIVDPYQLWEARVHGADAILLIVAILEEAQLRRLLGQAAELELAALVEVHDEGELGRALDAGAAIVGINNRDLRTFEVDLGTTERLAAQVPEGMVLVSESGYHSAEDIRRAAQSGVDAVLVGETLVTAADVAAKTAQLVRAGREARPDG